MAVFERSTRVDRSHRKLAHRGWYEGVVWVSASTGPARSGCTRPSGGRRGGPGARSASRSRSGRAMSGNSIWIYDTTHFARCRAGRGDHGDGPRDAQVDHRARLRRGDLARRSSSRSRTRSRARGAAGARRCAPGRELAEPVPVDDAVDALRPVLLAVSDNGPQMTSRARRASSWRCARSRSTSGGPAHPPTRPGSRACSATSRPTGRTCERIRDPAVLRAELAVGPPRAGGCPLAARCLRREEGGFCAWWLAGAGAPRGEVLGEDRGLGGGG